MAVSRNREHPSDGVGPYRRSCVGGRSTSAGVRSVAAIPGGRNARRRAVADCRPFSHGAHRDSSVHVFRDEILFSDVLLGEDGGAVSGDRFHIYGSSQNRGEGRRDAQPSWRDKACGFGFAIAMGHCCPWRTLDRVPLTGLIGERARQRRAERGPVDLDAFYIDSGDPLRIDDILEGIRVEHEKARVLACGQGAHPL
jgi:hypothetical protein